MSDQYEDFALRIINLDTEQGDYRYVIMVDSAPIADEDFAAYFEVPFDKDEIEDIVGNFEETIALHPPGSSPRALPLRDRIAKMGQRLYDALTSHTDIRSVYDQSRAVITYTNKKLRVRLRANRTLSYFPWEFLFGPKLMGGAKGFFVLDPRISLARYVPAWFEREKKSIDGPMRILIILACPQSNLYPQLDVKAEKDLIESSLQPFMKDPDTEDELLRIDYIEGGSTLAQLDKKLKQDEYHVIHFIGHGDYDPRDNNSFLVLERADRKHENADGQRLLTSLDSGMSSIRLVVLNACRGAVTSRHEAFGGVATSLVRSGIPAVVAMQFAVTDIAAKEIAANFYPTLMSTGSIDEALSSARVGLYMTYNDSLEWVTPVLYMGTTNGMLFEIPPERIETINKLKSIFKEFEDLYRKGQALLEETNFQEAFRVFDQIYQQNADFKDVSRKREEIAIELINHKWAGAKDLEKDDKWDEAAAIWRELKSMVGEFYPAHAEEPVWRKLKGAIQEEIELENSYQEMLSHSKGARWEEVIGLADNLMAKKGKYRDVDKLHAIAKKEIGDARIKITERYDDLENAVSRQAWDEVLKICQEILKIEPENSYVLRQMKEAQEISDLMQGIHIPLPAPSLTRKQANELYAEAEKASKDGRWEEANEICSRILDQNPKHKKALRLKTKAVDIIRAMEEIQIND